jgi:chromosome partitioning protein
MSGSLFSYKKALNVFGKEEGAGEMPPFSRGADGRLMKSWTSADLSKVGERIGFLPRLKAPVAASVFVTKGGVLKSSLTLNLARLAALHGIRTCVVGLDMQGDVSTALGETNDENDSLMEALKKMSAVKGLAQLYTGDATLDEILKSTDLPALFYIPETPELVALDQSLMSRNRREYWLRDHVVTPLKREFDLVLMDCSPNWNRLITNALVASDILISPLECKINNFRNLTTFRALIQEFTEDMNTSFKHVYVPTRYSPSRKLSREIREWYGGNLTNCSKESVRESIQGEEATAMRVSIPEFAPTSVAANEMRSLANEIWQSFDLSMQHSDAKSRSERAPAPSLNV